MNLELIDVLPLLLGASAAIIAILVLNRKRETKENVKPFSPPSIEKKTVTAVETAVEPEAGPVPAETDVVEASEHIAEKSDAATAVENVVIPETINDKWAEMQRMIASLPAADQADVDRENQSLCLCATCPTYKDCGGDQKESVFCTHGASSCIVDGKGCLCDDCQVYERMGLTKGQFCIDGSEASQRGL